MTHRPFRLARTALIAAAACATLGAAQAAVVHVANTNGNAPADIQASVDAFRAQLGALNANTPVNNAGGRREINWDGVPDNRADPNLLPGDFFNGAVAGRARGITFSTPGQGLLVSARASSGLPIAFGFPTEFVAFSAERMFSPLGSVVTDVRFFLPADQVTAASSLGFGAVFEDVEAANTTMLQFFDSSETLLHSIAVAAGANGSLSFAGAVFDSAQVARVRITAGDAVLTASGQYGPGLDGVVMDDFIYGEPTRRQGVPEPGVLGLLAAALAGMAWVGRRRRG